MTYQVLARKWRPKDFASLVGQEHVVRALTHALDGARLHHAYLFTGTRGVGKTTLSRIFAKALNCETGVTSTPCGVCRACREIDEGRFVDYVEMDAASNRGVDEMAALLERAVYAPVDARFKVYMIDEVHMLTNHAFNAMLKTLEEPPPHVKFILATTDPQKIPVTVLSRCLQFNLKQMPAGHIVSHLERILGEEGIPFEPQALRLLARAAQGSMRDALSLTDQAIAYSANEVTEAAVSGMLGALDQTYMVRLIDSLVAADGHGILAIADEMALRSLSFSTALQDLASLLHRIAWAQFAPASVLDEWPEAADLRRFAEQMSAEQVQLYYQIATVGRSELGLAPDEYAGFTMTLLRMLAFEPAGTAGVAGGSVPSALPATAAGAQGGRKAAVPAGFAAATAGRAQGVGMAAADAPAKPVPEARYPAAQEASAAVVSNPPDAKPAVESPSSAADKRNGQDAASTSARTSAPAPDVGETSAADRVPPMPPADVSPVSPVSAAATQSASDTQAASPSTASVPAASPVAAAPAAPPPAARAPSAPVAAEAPATPSAPAARTTGAAAALDVLRNAGLRVSSDRGRSGAAAAAKPAAPAPTSAPGVRPAPRASVPVPAPRPRDTKEATGANDAPPPWDDIPPDASDDYLSDYVPLSADDAFGAPPLDDRFVPVFDSGPDDVRVAPKPAAPPVRDARPLPPPIPLDAIGYDGEWPALAASLPLTGVAYQLAFNSELVAIEGGKLKLAVPVPQYADAAQVAKLTAALADALGKPVDVAVDVGPARRTAAALDAAARAERQREAERSIGADPFVQQLIREFGARIVEDSIRPLAQEPGGAGERAAPPTLH